VYRGKLLLEVRKMAEKEKNDTYQEEEKEEVKNNSTNNDTEEAVADTEVVAEEVEEKTKEEAEETVSIEDYETLKQEKEALEEEVEQLKDRLLRVQAEYDNFRKRTEKERIAMRKYEAEALATELLQVIDNFERALETEVDESQKGFYDGVKMVYNQFLEALRSQGVEVMDVIDQPFDPNLHHAVMQEEDESKESNIITEELQKGYMLKDKVIRPAMVKVNK